VLPSRALALGASLALVLSIQAPASSSEQVPQWDVRSDSGTLGDDVARFVAASPTLNMVNQGLDTVFVSGTSTKSPAARAAGLTDLDIGTTAYNANTGALRWRSTFDGGLGVTDTLGGFEVNHHNNLIYEVVNSGDKIVTIERSVADGKVSRSATYAGASADDSAISQRGGFLGVVGSVGGDFLALAYQTGGQTLELEARPVAGTALGADISHTGSLDTTRTLLATGRSSGFGTRGDVYTVAYNYRTDAKLWESTWASEGSRADEGLVAEAAHVSALNAGVGFVAGRTFTPETGWDILVTAHDLATGKVLWGPVRFDGEASGDDTPTHLVYSDPTSTLYLTGTSERGVPHGQDVVTIALDAATGERRGLAYASGNSSNADDAPTGLTVSKDGTGVFVAADVHNLLGSGSREAALFAYNSRLVGGGSASIGGQGDDRSAGVALNVAQDRVFLAGSSRDAATGFDHRAASFAISGFRLPAVEVPTQLAFTEASATQGQYTDQATLEARLTDDSGAPLAGRSVELSIGDRRLDVVSDAAGIARATFDLVDRPATYPATATFAGADQYLGSQTSTGFVIEREDAAISFAPASPDEGDYSDSVALEVALVDDTGTPLGGRAVEIGLGAESVSVETTQTGAASGAFTLTQAPGAYGTRAGFEGDEYFMPAEAAGSFVITEEDSSMSLTVSGKRSRPVLTATLVDADQPMSALSGREVTFYADGAIIGTAVTDDRGQAQLSPAKPLKGSSRDPVYRAVFAGDGYYLGSEAEDSF
jgi:hypothetical protein